jgi:hypothetical protein
MKERYHMKLVILLNFTLSFRFFVKLYYDMIKSHSTFTIYPFTQN